MKLREIAHSRTGDKGNTSNISVIAYDERHYRLLLDQVTSARVKAHFAGVVEGEVVRYELPDISALNFVMTRALGGGVTRSLALDAHGKSLSSALLDLEIEASGSSWINDGAKTTMPNVPTLASLAEDLESGRISARKLVEECLERIADPSGEGMRAFVHVDKDAAIEAADAIDRLRGAGAAPSIYAGIPVSIKDLFDVRGQVSRAGSRALDDSAPAEADAPVVARLRRAGFIVIGRTNMTEFAYSGIGINPHYGTPKSTWRRNVGHVPGGSSSGAAVSVADRMAYGALGTDTGGSCRIPAAYNGIVGFKPTQRRVPREGGVPLSFTLDSCGPLARSVDCCAVLDAVLADEPIRPLQPRPVRGMRLAVPTTIAFDEIEDEVARAFERALEDLSQQGALIERIAVPEFLDVGVMNTKGGFAAAESYAWHRYLLASHGDVYDPRVSSRILRGEAIAAADYIDLLEARKSLIARIAVRLAPYDALAMPTTPITPPRIADLADDKAYGRANLLSLRNCTLINMIDGCAISLPCHREGEVPVGLMLAACAGSDRRIFELAAAIEGVVRV